jgi:hypothetical protein
MADDGGTCSPFSHTRSTDGDKLQGPGAWSSAEFCGPRLLESLPGVVKRIRSLRVQKARTHREVSRAEVRKP